MYTVYRYLHKYTRCIPLFHWWRMPKHIEKGGRQVVLHNIAILTCQFLQSTDIYVCIIKAFVNVHTVWLSIWSKIYLVRVLHIRWGLHILERVSLLSTCSLGRSFMVRLSLPGIPHCLVVTDRWYSWHETSRFVHRQKL